MVTIGVSSAFLRVGLKKIFCIPLCAELHEGVETVRQFQEKDRPVVDGQAKVSVTRLMATMASDVVLAIGKKCILVLDAYFAVGPVFKILKQVRGSSAERLLHIVTRAKKNVVGYMDPPPKTGAPGRPREYGEKLILSNLFNLFDTWADLFIPAEIEIYGRIQVVSILCLDLIWKPVKEKIRFVLVKDDSECFILMCSDLALSPIDIIRAYSYRFKIEVSFKVLKHVMGVFFYRFWTQAWPRIGKRNESDLSFVEDARNQRLIVQATSAIEAFTNFGCIATGILQIVALNYHETIWSRYLGWLRTITSAVPSEEVVKSVIQEEYYHNFRFFRNSAIYRIIMSKSRRRTIERLQLAA